MKRFSRLGVVFGRVMLILAAALSVQAAGAQVLEQVPGDALVVVHAKNLQAISQKIAALAKQWGIVEMNPAMSDPLGYLLGQAKITEGLDKSGDAAMVLANGDLKAEPPPMILLIPVSDYQKFIGNFAGAQKDGELDKFKMSFGGEPGDEDTYAANWGHYAAITPTKALLAKKPEGFKASPAAAKEVAGKDAVVIFNMKVIGPIAKEKIDAHKDEMAGLIDSQFSQIAQASPYIPLLKVALTQGISATESLLTETDCATLSFDLQSEGVSVGAMVDFINDSNAGKNVASVKGTGASLLAGLPEAKYLMFGGGRMEGDGLKQAANEFLAPIQDQLSRGNADQQHLSAYLDSMKNLLNDQKGQTFGLIAPAGALGTPMFQWVGVQSGDSEAILKDQQKMIVASQDVMGLLPNQPKMTTEVKPNAKTVDGISFSQVTTTIGDSNAPGAAAAKQMLNMLYGPDGIVVYMGAVDGQHVLGVSGTDDAMIAAAIKAVKEQNDPFTKDEGLTQVRKHLPQTKVSEMYINVADIVTTAVTYAKMLGMPLPVTMKAGIPPIGFAIATDGPSIRGDMYVPSDLIEQIVAMALQFNMGGAKNGGL